MGALDVAIWVLAVALLYGSVALFVTMYPKRPRVVTVTYFVVSWSLAGALSYGFVSWIT